MRSLIRSSFNRKNSYKKPNKSEILLGCNWLHFKEYFEKLFKPGMSWSNHGDWHIDHIVPLSTGKNVNDIIKLCHHSNLQPLWATENLKKSDRI